MAFRVKKRVSHEDSKWVEHSPQAKVLITSIDNPQYQVALARIQRETWRNDSKFGISEGEAVDGEKPFFESQCRLFAKYILKGWEGSGFETEDGGALEFSEQNAFELLSTNAEFFVFVLDSAQNYSAELREELTDVVEKPSPDSNGKKPGRAAPKK